jgi:serine/threonine-protein kinase
LSPVSPESWGQLQIRERIGEGASAEVFRARDPRLDRDVALKLFRHGQWMTPEQRRMLLMEGQNLARLRHENIVAVHGADEHEGRVGIWMDLVEGRTLSEVVRTQGAYSAGEAAQIGVELCRALAAVHRKNLVHADIKGQNIKREEGGRIVLMDFSSSRRADDSPGNPESDPMGTPLYMAPELWDKNNPTVESDIYALGVLLYHLVTGEFPVRATSIELLRQAHANRERHLLRDERPGLPDGFVRTVEKALSANPLDRFRTAGALEEALHAQQELVRRDTPTPPLPVEVRVIARVARIGLWTVGVAMAFLALGFITSNAFNTTIGRPAEFASETVPDWFLFGVRATSASVIYMAIYAAPLAGISLLWRLVKLIPPIAKITARIRARYSSRIAAATDPTTLSTLLFAFGLLALIGVCFRYGDIIVAAATPIAEVERENLVSLSPDNIDAHMTYGRFLDAIMLVLGYGSYRLFRLAKERGTRAAKPLSGVLAVLLATMLLWVFPYRILFHNQFEKISFDEERAYIIGQRSDEILIHCPDAAPPRNRIVSAKDAGIVRLQIRESVFASPQQN